MIWWEKFIYYEFVCIIPLYPLCCKALLDDMHDFSMIHEINFHSSRFVFLSSFRYHRWSTNNSHCLLVLICESHKRGGHCTGYNLCLLWSCQHIRVRMSEIPGLAQMCPEHGYPCPGPGLRCTYMWLLRQGAGAFKQAAQSSFSQSLSTAPPHRAGLTPGAVSELARARAAKPPWKWEGAAALMGLSGLWKL